jgi:hypothetical protein
MSKLTKEEVIRILSQAIDDPDLNLDSNNENTETWDSLGQLTIYTTIARIVQGDDSVLRGLNSLNSIRDILDRLQVHGFIR